MNRWVDEAWSFLQSLVGFGAQPLDWALFGASVILTALIMMKLMGWATGNAQSTWFLNLLALAFGSALLLAAVAAGRIWVVPLVGDRVSVHVVDGVAVAVGLLLLAVPVLCLIQRIRYITAFMTLLVAGITSAFVYLFVTSGRDAFRSGRDVYDAVRDRGEHLRETIDAR